MRSHTHTHTHTCAVILSTNASNRTHSPPKSNTGPSNTSSSSRSDSNSSSHYSCLRYMIRLIPCNQDRVRHDRCMCCHRLPCRCMHVIAVYGIAHVTHRYLYMRCTCACRLDSHCPCRVAHSTRAIATTVATCVLTSMYMYCEVSCIHVLIHV